MEASDPACVSVLDSGLGSSAIGSWDCTLGVSAVASWRRMSSWRSSSISVSKFAMDGAAAEDDSDVAGIAMFGKRAVTSAGASA